MADLDAELPDEVQGLLCLACDLYELSLQRPISHDPQVMDVCEEMFEALKRIWPFRTAEVVERALRQERQGRAQHETEGDV